MHTSRTFLYVFCPIRAVRGEAVEKDGILAKARAVKVGLEDVSRGVSQEGSVFGGRKVQTVEAAFYFRQDCPRGFRRLGTCSVSQLRFHLLPRINFLFHLTPCWFPGATVNG